MEEDRGELDRRRFMIAGLAFVALFVAGVFVSFANSPSINSGDSDATVAGRYVDYLSNSGHRVVLLIGGYLLILSAMAFVWLGIGLRARLAPAVGQFVAGLTVLGAAAIAVGAIASAAIAGAVDFGGEPVPRDGDTIRMVMDLAFPLLFVVFGLVSAALIVTVAVGARHAGMPAWMFYASWVAALGGVFAALFVPMVLPLLWYLAIAVTGMTRPVHSTPAVLRARQPTPTH